MSTMDYVQTPVRPTKKVDLMIITEMSSFKIIWHLTHRHRVGLLASAVLLLVSYIAYDKVLHLFF